MKILTSDVIKLISEVCEIPEEKISEKSNLMTDLELESLDIVTLISECEDEYHLTIPDKDIETLQTVKDIVDYLNKVCDAVMFD